MRIAVSLLIAGLVTFCSAGAEAPGETTCCLATVAAAGFAAETDSAAIEGPWNKKVAKEIARMNTLTWQILFLI
jgi:hypothetical protein